LGKGGLLGGFARSPAASDEGQLVGAGVLQGSDSADFVVSGSLELDP
jgi:hypothetical protein